MRSARIEMPEPEQRDKPEGWWSTVATGDYPDCAALVAALRARGIPARVVVDQKGEES